MSNTNDLKYFSQMAENDYMPPNDDDEAYIDNCVEQDYVPPKPDYSQYLGQLGALDKEASEAKAAFKAAYATLLAGYEDEKAKTAAKRINIIQTYEKASRLHRMVTARLGSSASATASPQEHTKRRDWLEQKYIELAYLVKNAETALQPYYVWHENHPDRLPGETGAWVLLNAPNAYMRNITTVKNRLASHVAKMKAFWFMHPSTIWRTEIQDALEDKK